MSRKKSQFDNSQLKKIGSRIKIEREKLGLSQAKFGESIGISGNYLSDLETGKVEPRKPVLLALEYRYAISGEYLLFGTQPKNIPGVKTTGLLTEAGAVLDEEDVAISDLLEAARKVLKSGNLMAMEALEKNIKYFAHAIEIENRLSGAELAIHEMRKEFDNLKSEWAAKRASVGGATKRKAM